MRYSSAPGSGTTVAGSTNLNGYLKPTGAKYETVPRTLIRAGITSASTSGTLKVTAIGLPAGELITSISVMSAGAAVTPTNQWFVLLGSDRAKLAITSDDTTTAWGANSVKTLNLATPYTTTTAGLFYIGVLQVAGTPATHAAYDSSGQTGGSGASPILWGTSSTGLTDPASCPATPAALTLISNLFYAYVS